RQPPGRSGIFSLLSPMKIKRTGIGFELAELTTGFVARGRGRLSVPGMSGQAKGPDFVWHKPQKCCFDARAQQSQWHTAEGSMQAMARTGFC
ncbi:MAG: hypothetical protein LDL16_09305, partial [Thiobacillus sp.]|nr:hypothetical protein [Thiobacillus sp.]